MNLDTIIDELQDYCYVNNDLITDNKDCINDYQIKFLDGFIEILFNKLNDKDLFEVYINIKSTNKIADSLLYKSFNNQEEAEKYFEELKFFINNNDEKNITNHCKIKE